MMRLKKHWPEWLIMLVEGALVVYVVCAVLPSRLSSGDVEHVVVTVNNSIHYTEEEILSAVDCIKEEFRKYTDCTLLALKYDDSECWEVSALHARNYGKPETNVIVLRGDLQSGKRTLFTPYILCEEKYVDFIWILERIDSSSEWTVLAAHGV